MREKIAELIWKYEDALSDGFQYYAVDAKEVVERLADAILSLPSGFIAGEHEITIEEALETLNSIINEPRYYFEAGSLLLEDSLTNGKWIQCDALTFNGHLITEPIPSSEDK